MGARKCLWIKAKVSWEIERLISEGACLGYDGGCRIIGEYGIKKDDTLTVALCSGDEISWHSPLYLAL